MGFRGETFGNVAQGMWEVVIVLVTRLSVLRGLRPQGRPCCSAVSGEEKIKVSKNLGLGSYAERAEFGD